MTVQRQGRTLVDAIMSSLHVAIAAAALVPSPRWPGQSEKGEQKT